MKKLNGVVGFICGVLASLLVVSAGAASTVNLDNVLVNSVNVVANGRLLVDAGDWQDEANGIPSSIVIRGTTFLPVRLIGTSFSSRIDWRGEDMTVIIGRDVPDPVEAPFTYEEFRAMVTVSDNVFSATGRLPEGDEFYPFAISVDPEIKRVCLLLNEGLEVDDATITWLKYESTYLNDYADELRDVYGEQILLGFSTNRLNANVWVLSKY